MAFVAAIVAAICLSLSALAGDVVDIFGNTYANGGLFAENSIKEVNSDMEIEFEAETDEIELEGELESSTRLYGDGNEGAVFTSSETAINFGAFYTPYFESLNLAGYLNGLVVAEDGAGGFFSTSSDLDLEVERRYNDSETDGDFYGYGFVDTNRGGYGAASVDGKSYLNAVDADGWRWAEASSVGRVATEAQNGAASAAHFDSRVGHQGDNGGSEIQIEMNSNSSASKGSSSSSGGNVTITVVDEPEEYCCKG